MRTAPTGAVVSRTAPLVDTVGGDEGVASEASHVGGVVIRDADHRRHPGEVPAFEVCRRPGEEVQASPLDGARATGPGAAVQEVGVGIVGAQHGRHAGGLVVGALGVLEVDGGDAVVDELGQPPGDAVEVRAGAAGEVLCQSGGAIGLRLGQHLDRPTPGADGGDVAAGVVGGEEVRLAARGGDRLQQPERPLAPTGDGRFGHDRAHDDHPRHSPIIARGDRHRVVRPAVASFVRQTVSVSAITP